LAVDKVKPLKIESASTGGTEDDMFPHEADPAEDYLSARGLAFKNQDTTLIDTDGSDNIQFTDPVVGVKTVDQVRSTVRVTSNDTTPNSLLAKLVSGAGVTIAEVNDGGNEQISISSLFGTDFFSNESDAISTTTNIVYQEKLKLSVNLTAAGDYLLFWFFSTKNPNGNSKEMQTRVELDDTTTLTEAITRDTKDEWVPTTGFDLIALTSGVHTFDIDFREIADLASIRRARLAIWRIS